MTRTSLAESAETERIRALLDEYTTAIRNKDADAVIALYTDDVVAFDLAPPLRLESERVLDRDALRSWFDTWSGPIESESRDLTIRVAGDLAYAFALQHMTGTKTDGEESDLWFRATACFARRDGRWRIAHVHNSVPFAMDGSGRALLDLEP
jgi:uncharacterized protein (TIGR02246 family)